MINEEIATKVPEVARDGDYWLAADGKVYREEALIGTLDKASGKVIYEPDMQRYKNRVGRLVNGLSAEALDSLPEFELSPEGGEPVVSAPDLEPEAEAQAPAKAVRELSLTEIMCDFPEGAPAYDWRGDLTPEFIEWYFKEYPERAKRRYETRQRIPALAAYFNR